jgi:peptidoglycan-N-acetylglucosamine deacetylase
VVRTGDTLYRIALRYRVTVAALAATNNISDPRRIFVGQTLLIPTTDPQIPALTPPGVSPTPIVVDGQRYHIVRSGENLFRIALRYGVPLNRLAEVNQITNPRQIFVGQIIVIPDE